MHLPSVASDMAPPLGAGNAIELLVRLSTLLNSSIISSVRGTRIGFPPALILEDFLFGCTVQIFVSKSNSSSVAKMIAPVLVAVRA